MKYYFHRVNNNGVVWSKEMELHEALDNFADHVKLGLSPEVWVTDETGYIFADYAIGEYEEKALKHWGKVYN